MKFDPSLISVHCGHLLSSFTGNCCGYHYIHLDGLGNGMLSQICNTNHPELNHVLEMPKQKPDCKILA